MPKINLSGMTVEALMDRESGLTKPFISVVPSFNGSWRGWAAQGLFEALEAH